MRLPGIRSIGWWVPEKRRTAREIACDYDLSEEAVTQMGLMSHPVPGPDDHPAALGARATRAALAAAGLATEDLDLLIFAGVTRDWPTPWVAAFGVLHELGSTRAAGFDLSSRCAGGIDALWMARSLVDNGTYRTVAVCCAERFDYLLGPPRVPELPSDAFYSVGAATALVTAEAGNEIVAFSNLTNPDLSLHQAMGPQAGGSRQPVSGDALDRGTHRWRSGLTLRDVVDIARFSADADRYNYPRLLARAGFEAVDFVVCSPLDPPPQLEVLEELGIDSRNSLFTVPWLGHIGPADLFLILGVAVATGRELGHRVVLSTRTPVYANALAVRGRPGENLDIATAGQGLDLALWGAGESAARESGAGRTDG